MAILCYKKVVNHIAIREPTHIVLCPDPTLYRRGLVTLSLVCRWSSVLWLTKQTCVLHGYLHGTSNHSTNLQYDRCLQISAVNSHMTLTEL